MRWHMCLIPIPGQTTTETLSQKSKQNAKYNTHIIYTCTIYHWDYTFT